MLPRCASLPGTAVKAGPRVTLNCVRSWSFFNKKPEVEIANANPNTQPQTGANILRQTSADASAQTVDGEPRVEPKAIKATKTMAQLDQELRLAMEGRAGDGGDAGIEFEDGKPVAMKRGVKDNMFRYI